MGFDKSKFFDRDGDSEGFTLLDVDYGPLETRIMAHMLDRGPINYEGAVTGRFSRSPEMQELPCRPGEVYGFVDTSNRISDTQFQEHVSAIAEITSWAQLPDEVLEAAFQAWLRTSTRPENAEDFRKRLRQRIEDMVRKCSSAPVDIADAMGARYDRA